MDGAFKTRVAVASLIVAGLTAQAGGLWLYEKGNPDNMTAVAGRAALANDASTAASNPAGMTRLQSRELLLGAQPMYMDSQFDPNSRTTMPGDDGGQAGCFSPAASFYYVHPLSDDWRLGLTSTSTYGAALDYGDDFVGRYTVMNTSLLTLTLGPSLAYRISDQLSVGVGGYVTYAKLEQETAVPNVLPPGPDGKVILDEDTFGYGGTVGILVEPRKGTRFGATYMTPVKLKFEDLISSEGLNPGWLWLLGNAGILGAKTDIEMTMPQGIMLSGYHDLNDKWALVGNVGWQDTSVVGKMDVTVHAPGVGTIHVDDGFQDTYHFALGARYRINEKWLWGFGVAYDTSPIDSKTERTPDMPLDCQIRYATGVEYTINASQTLGVAYTFVDLGSAAIEKAYPGGNVSGEYASNYLHILTVSWGIKF